MGDDEIIEDEIPQVAFIGRSNVGKSSTINAVLQTGLAKSSSKPGKTREINFYLLNKDLYLVDLPGYGYAAASLEERDNLRKLIYWYLLFSDIEHKRIIMIIDAVVGMTKDDLEILRRLDEREKDLVIVANKVDKIRKSEYNRQIAKIREQAGKHSIIPFSAEKKIGLAELNAAIF